MRESLSVSTVDNKCMNLCEFFGWCLSCVSLVLCLPVYEGVILDKCYT